MGRKGIDISKLKGRGKSLYIAVLNSGYTNKQAAQRANYQEATFYSHIKQERLDYKILAKYGKAINHDFSAEYPEITEYQIENPSDRIAKESRPYIDLHAKYTAVLEINNKLLVEINEVRKELDSTKAELAALKKKGK